MPSRTSPTPSPPPTAPQITTSTPGPRATALHKVYTSALTSTLKANSYPNLAACFPTPAKYCPTALEGVWRQLNARLEEECQKDFEKILEERNTVEGLNTLDALIGQARERKDRGIEGESQGEALHMLSAQQLGEARMHGFLVQAKGELETKVEESQNKNQVAVRRIKEQREEIERLIGGLEGLVGDLEGAVHALEGVDGEELKTEAWEMEMEIRKGGAPAT